MAGICNINSWFFATHLLSSFCRLKICATRTLHNSFITNFIFQTALEILGWSSEEARFPLEGRVLFTQPNDANWKKVWTVKMTSIQALLCVLSPEELPEVTSNKELIFPPEGSPIKDASLIMVREKNSKYTLVRVSFLKFLSWSFRRSI